MISLHVVFFVCTKQDLIELESVNLWLIKFEKFQPLFPQLSFLLSPFGIQVHTCNLSQPHAHWSLRLDFFKVFFPVV